MKKSIEEEPQKEWGGIWTMKKLDAFTKYVASYLTIMKKNPYWKTIYFDGFAGNGSKKPRCNNRIYHDLFLSEEEENVYKGSAERILSINKGLAFDFYYFIDINEKSIKELERRLSAFQKYHPQSFQFRPGDCNKNLQDLSSAMKSRKNEFAALVLLDPFGMQIDWTSIASLKDTRSDIWILVPTGVIVNRLLDRSGKLKHIDKLQSFFGLSESLLKDYFYKIDSIPTLFGDEREIVNKVTRPIEKIADLYIERLNTIWKYVSKNPMILYYSKHVPIFHFVFASNNATAYRIASQIIDVQ
jgi:three-Cys-motif partner protein